MGSVEKERVCVTGGTGFIGSWLIKSLLEKGYCVNAPIRHPRPEKKKDISYLTMLPGAKEQLSIFEADLKEPGSFGPAIQGCVGVFHLAHCSEAEDIAKVNVEAALSILEASVASKTVRRVVYVSSAAAVVNNREAATAVGNSESVNPLVLDEESWSDVQYMKEALPAMLSSYGTAKTLTEKALLQYKGDADALEVVTVVPSYATGAFLTPWLPGSITAPLSPLFGNHNAYPRLFNIKMVHVDDLARALIFLFESTAAAKGGRYIAVSYHGQFRDLCQYLESRYPDLYAKHSNTQPDLNDIKGPVPPGMSARKLLDAGFQFIHGRDHMFDDAIRSCKDKGIL